MEITAASIMDSGGFFLHSGYISAFPEENTHENVLLQQTEVKAPAKAKQQAMAVTPVDKLAQFQRFSKEASLWSSTGIGLLVFFGGLFLFYRVKAWTGRGAKSKAEPKQPAQE